MSKVALYPLVTLTLIQTTRKTSVYLAVKNQPI